MTTTITEIMILITALISFMFSMAIFFHGRKDLVENIFSFLAFNFSLWSLSTFFVTSRHVPFAWFKLGAFTHYVSGNLIFLSFLLFAIYYIFRLKISRFWLLSVVFINALIVVLVVFKSFLFLSLKEGATTADKIHIDPVGYSVFSVIMLLMFVIAQFYLFQKYKAATALDKKHLGFLILGTSISGSCGLFFNLILPGFSIFSFFYVGPIIAMPLFVGVLIYAIVKYELFNLRVIAAEIFTALLTVALLVNLLASSNRNEVVIGGIVLFLSLIFGYFLIRSVYQEIRQKEEIQRLADDLEKANLELKKLDQLKSEFVSLASHQLRTPLTVIKGYISMIQEGSFGKVPKELEDALRKIYTSNERLINLVGDFLNLSRIESGRMKYAFMPTNVEEIMQSVYEEFIEVAKEKKLKLSYDQPEEPLPQAMVDRDKFRQVIMNLLDNSIKYTPEGSVKIKIEEEDGRDGKNILISISDTGIGMAEDDLNSIFKRFSRGEEGSKTNTAGLGLGLYLAKRIVTDHGGEIWATSEGAGKGSIFWVRIPARADETLRENQFGEFISKM